MGRLVLRLSVRLKFTQSDIKSVCRSLCCAAYKFSANVFANVFANVCDDLCFAAFLKSVKCQVFALTLLVKKVGNGCLKGIFWGADYRIA